MTIHGEVGFKSNIAEPHQSNFRSWVGSFVNEIALYTSLMPKNWTPEIWWEYKERALLGFFVSGIARNQANSDLAILQEFSVQDENSQGGKRADLYLQKEKTGYLIETKYRRDSPLEGHFEELSKADRYSAAFSQVQNYFNLEMKWYEYLNNLVLTVLYFQPLHFNKSPKGKSNHVKKAIDFTPSLENSFYTLVDPKPGKMSTVLEIYGKIEEISIKPK